MTDNHEPGTYVILPDGSEADLSKKMDAAVQHIGFEMTNFLGYIEDQWPELQRHEAIHLAALIIGAFRMSIKELMD